MTAPDLSADIDIAYRDAALLVVRKAAGLLSVPGRGEHLQDCVASRVQARWPDARVVHRLDMATSGLLVMALGPDAQRALSRAFERREVKKRYVAVVAGQVGGEAGSITLALRSDWPNRPRQMVDPELGRPALTNWWRGAEPSLTIDGRQPIDRTRLTLEPITGRTHQLRVHLHALGHPILGDPLYHSDGSHSMAPRLLLHATRIELPHPTDARPMAFEDPAPF